MPNQDPVAIIGEILAEADALIRRRRSAASSWRT